MKILNKLVTMAIVISAVFMLASCELDTGRDIPKTETHMVQWNQISGTTFIVRTGNNQIDSGSYVEDGTIINISCSCYDLDVDDYLVVTANGAQVSFGEFMVNQDTNFVVSTSTNLKPFEITNTTNMSNGTVRIQDGTAWFSTGIPNTEIANPNFGRQSGTIQINQVGALILRFDVVADMNYGDWIVFTVNVGHSAATVDSCHIGIRRDEQGNYFIGGIPNWPSVHAGTNNGIPNLAMVNQPITDLNDIRIVFDESYHSAQLGDFNFYQSAAPYGLSRLLHDGSTMIRNIWLIRTSMDSEIGVKNIRMA
ncbi:MAG: hypothetical protein FWE16_01290 [Firmicutes bacterium]|nr:hypothetical protein [Bacillota bacterium]